MNLVVILLRTAIGMLSGLLGWVLMVWLAASAGPLAAAVAGGFFGGMVCMSLGPNTGQQVALTAGAVMTFVAFFMIWEPLYPHNWVFNYWPGWIPPAYFSGAAIWLLAARKLQNRG